MASLRNTVMFPLETFSKADAKDAQLDTKKSFDKAYKDLDTKL